MHISFIRLAFCVWAKISTQPKKHNFSYSSKLTLTFICRRQYYQNHNKNAIEIFEREKGS